MAVHTDTHNTPDKHTAYLSVMLSDSFALQKNTEGFDAGILIQIKQIITPLMQNTRYTQQRCMLSSAVILIPGKREIHHQGTDL